MNWQKTACQKQILLFLFSSCALLFAGATVSIDAKIVFCVADNIYVMNDDGSGRRRLTNNTLSADSDPRWSPDGKRIAFTRYMDKEKIQTSSELFIMNADGTHTQRLTHNNVADADPSWSPDGQHLAFTSLRGGKLDVYVLDVATQTVKQLTGIGDKEQSAAPDWSPDGTQMTYERFMLNVNGLAPKNIWVMSATGQHQRPLLPDPQEGDTLIMRFYPRWSADGQRILFDEFKWRGKHEKHRYFVQRIGGRAKEVADINARLGNNWIAAGASWMDADRAMLFSIKRSDKPNPNYDIYRYAFETRGLRRITREPSDERNPDWIQGALAVSPHGKLTKLWGEIKQAPPAERR